MKKKITLIIISLLILASIPVAVFMVRRNQELRLQAAPATTLSLAPASSTKIVDNVFSISIQIDTGTNIVNGADIDISYNSSVLQAESITSGTFFTSSVETRNNVSTPGKIRYSLLTGNVAGARSGSGILATISFKAIAVGTATVSFDSTTAVSDATDFATNVLSQSSGGTYIIQASEAEATATPIATATPTEVDDGGGVGGNITTTPTPTTQATPTPTDSSGAGGADVTATPTPTTSLLLGDAEPTPTPTTADIPVTGISAPTLFLILGAVALFIGGLIFI